MSIICIQVIEQDISASGTSPDEPYLCVEVCITPEKAAEMVATLDSNGSSERATRDPLSRAVLEAIQAAEVL